MGVLLPASQGNLARLEQWAGGTSWSSARSAAGRWCWAPCSGCPCCSRAGSSHRDTSSFSLAVVELPSVPHRNSDGSPGKTSDLIIRPFFVYFLGLRNTSTGGVLLARCNERETQSA